MKTEALNTLVLVLCQVLLVVEISIDLTMTGLAGQSLARNTAFSTLPFAMITVGGAFAMPYIGHLMRRKGRKFILQLGAVLGMIGGAVSCLAMIKKSFLLLCVGATLSGCFQATGQFYRLAVADGIAESSRARVVSYVLAGGVVAAFVGPSLAVASRLAINSAPFAGSYILVSILCFLAVTLISTGYKAQEEFTPSKHHVKAGYTVPLTVLKEPTYLTATVNNVTAGFVMILMMTAAPLAIVDAGGSVAEAARVMRWHLIGMYGPSLVAGWIFARLGAPRTLFSGLLLSSICITLSLQAHSAEDFYIALLALGVGWNLSFVSSSILLSGGEASPQRLKAQSASETLRYAFSAVASLSAGGLFHFFGWVGLNLCAVPFVIVAAATTLWWSVVRRPSGRLEEQPD